MMKKTKKRFITFHNLYEIHHHPIGQITPKSIHSTIEYIKSKNKINRKYHVNSEKICLMESAFYNKPADVFELLFKSAKHGTRKPLINRNTTNERENPKTLDEGEIEMVHLVLKVKKTETIIHLEKNRDGLTIRNIIDYFNHFQREINQKTGNGEDFHYKEESVIREDFLEELKKLKRIKLATVYYDKAILGDEYLNLSNRTKEVKQELEVNIKPSWGQSLKEISIDIFNKLGSRKQRNLRKVRVEGVDEANGVKVLNTEAFEKKETLEIEYDIATGILNTTDAFRKLRALINLD